MFDMFRESYERLAGIDVDAAKKEREEKKANKLKEKYILSMKSKIVITVVGIMYFLTTFSLLFVKSDMSIVFYLKNIMLILIDIFILFCLFFPKIFGKNRSEIFIIIGISIYVITLLISIYV